MKTIALVMIVKNEERCLKRCLDSVKGIVDKIIIVDTGSQDRTLDIARASGADVYTYTWKNDFADARNYALSHSDADWNLILDADEYISSGTREDIAPFLESEPRLGSIYIRNVYMDEGEKSYNQSKTIRLLPKGVKFTGKIHEQADSSLPCVLLPILVEHDGYLHTGKKEKRNLPYMLQELQKQPHNPYLLYKIAGSYQTLKDEEKALKTFREFYSQVPPTASYRAKGVVGYLFSLMTHKKFAEILEIIKQEETALKDYASFHFFCGVFYMQLILSDTARYIQYLPKIEQSYLRCLEIGENTKDEEDMGVGTYKAAYNLGTWYEVSGSVEKARKYYQEAAKQGYTKASERLMQMNGEL